MGLTYLCVLLKRLWAMILHTFRVQGQVWILVGKPRKAGAPFTPERHLKAAFWTGEPQTMDLPVQNTCFGLLVDGRTPA